MIDYHKNPYIQSGILPADIVFHPSWWYKNSGITFDEDFFYHPLRRVEVEKRMEHELYERFGQFGLGSDHSKDLPVIGAVHNAAGYLLSEMLGCKVKYEEGGSPQVIPAGNEKLDINIEKAFRSTAFYKFSNLLGKLKGKYGYVTGDINWSGVLNIALDLAGEQVLIDFFSKPEGTREQFAKIAEVIEKFVMGITSETGTNSISVNRNVRNIKKPVFLHSECSHTMIDAAQYEEFLLPIDEAWSRKFRPFGVHYCGTDPHRFSKSFGKISHLDFLDVGWGGDVKELRKNLSETFLNIRLDPVTINNLSENEIEETIIRLVNDSGNPHLTGICCINMDDKAEDSKIKAIFRAVIHLKERFENKTKT